MEEKEKSNTEFRWAEEKDLPLILRFIRQLAEYEKMSDEVVATENLLKEWLLEKKIAEVFFCIRRQERNRLRLVFP